MGCDIHQMNILIDADTKQAYAVDGETSDDRPYESDYVEEFIPGRSYSQFAILAGVRGDEFQITSNVYTYIPEELPQALKNKCEDESYAWHSFTWYYMADLLEELKWTKKKVKMYLNAMANSNPEFIISGGVDEYRWTINGIARWIRILKETREKLKAAGKEADFKTSKIFFAFDS